MGRLRTTVRAPGRPITAKKPARVVEAIGLYVALYLPMRAVTYGTEEYVRLEYLLKQLTPKETDAYHDGIIAARKEFFATLIDEPAGTDDARGEEILPDPGLDWSF